MIFETTRRCNTRYEQELKKQEHPYADWIRHYESGEDQEFYTPIYGQEPYIVAVVGEGALSSRAKGYFSEAFHNPDVIIAYGDEDIMDDGGDRTDPWFQPEWSPDTFLSHFYMGHAVAIRKEFAPKESITTIKELYQTLVHIINQLLIEKRSLAQAIYHIPRIVYHGIKVVEPLGIGPEYESIQNGCLLQASYDLENQEELVSIIIPSKDHSELLNNCLSSIVTYTKGIAYEIIVVDNGSCEEEQRNIQTLQSKIPFQYIVEPMEFHFSKMCNLGVAHAKGKWILLLNDDVEAIEIDWLSKMLHVARRTHVGVVGAKLLFPMRKHEEVPCIQHIGVTNIGVGPVHKLIGEKDNDCYYHGVNQGQWNKVAVTGACFLVERGLYEQYGGLSETFKVAYNDVDFCMRLGAAGYYHVVCNDVVLLHHESLSRGNDLTCREKTKRLERERTALYEHNPKYCDEDPFYSPHLIQDADYYECNSMLPCDQKEYLAVPVKKGVKPLPARNKIHPFYYIEKCEVKYGIVTVAGWSFLNEVNNACYDTYICFQNKKKSMWNFQVMPKYRRDVAKLAERQINNGLSGMVVRFAQKCLPNGEYEVVLKKKNKVTGYVQYVHTGRYLLIE